MWGECTTKAESTYSVRFVPLNITWKILTITSSVLASASVLMVLLLFLSGTRIQAAALPTSHTGPPNATSWQQQTYTPVVTITVPSVNAVLTAPTQLVQVECAHGTNIVVGSALLDAVSVTVNGGVTYHEALSRIIPGRYVYTWTLLSEEDYETHVLYARARNGWGNVGTSSPVTVRVDTVPPQRATITVPSYTENTSFTVTWSATDGSGVVIYDLRYQRDDETEWTYWLTGTATTSRVFSVTTQDIEEGHDYIFQMLAWDVGRNRSDWIADAIRVGPRHLYLPLVVRNYLPSWQQAKGIEGVKVYDITFCPTDPSLQYAGTDSGVYRSTDGGSNWDYWALTGEATPVVVNPKDCSGAFATVWGSGVYSVTAQGQETLISQDPELLRLYGLDITDDGQTLYAGTSSNGVYKSDTDTINWIDVSNNMSSLDLRIRSLVIISDTLYAGSRRCTYYSSKNWGTSWSIEPILSGGQEGDCQDAQVWAIAEMGNVRYAGLGLDKGLHRREQEIWTPVAGFPTTSIYGFGLRAYGSRLYVSARGYGVYTCNADGDCQSLPYNGLGELKLRGLAIAPIPGEHPRLLAGSDDGVWWVPLVP